VKRSTAIAKAGRVITCPHCFARIGALTATVHRGWQFQAGAIRFTKGQSPTSGQPKCRIFLNNYVEIEIHVVKGKELRDMLIHTDEGWVPRCPSKHRVARMRRAVGPSDDLDEFGLAEGA
jgi:hypothetical protein